MSETIGSANYPTKETYERLRRQMVEEGLKLLTTEELEKEIAERTGRDREMCPKCLCSFGRDWNEDCVCECHEGRLPLVDDPDDDDAD